MAAFRTLSLLALPFLAAAASAQAPAPAAPAIPGVSAQGNAALAKFRGGDAQAKQLFAQIRATAQQLQLETQRPALNLDLIASLLKKMDGLQAQFRTRQTDLLIQALHALPPADRTPFIKATIARPSTPAR
jgi:hypothetical protein